MVQKVQQKVKLICDSCSRNTSLYNRHNACLPFLKFRYTFQLAINSILIYQWKSKRVFRFLLFLFPKGKVPKKKNGKYPLLVDQMWIKKIAYC